MSILAPGATVDPVEAGRLMRRATYASTGAAILLITIKAVAWFMTGSIAMLSSLVDSLLDGFASLMTLFAVQQSLVPADREHRFGHGKAEALAALGQSAFVTGSAVLLLFEAGSRLFRPRAIEAAGIGIGVMLASIAVTIVLVLYQRWVVDRSGSLAISADSLHYTGDLLVNLAVILALVLSGLMSMPILDPIFGAGIAAFLLYSAWRIARGSLDMLLDRELVDADRDRIRRIALSHPEVKAVHDLRSRQSGQTYFVQLHLELDGTMSLVRAHQISDEVEGAIMAIFPQAEVIIHQDPEGLEEEHPRFH